MQLYSVLYRKHCQVKVEAKPKLRRLFALLIMNEESSLRTGSMSSDVNGHLTALLIACQQVSVWQKGNVNCNRVGPCDPGGGRFTIAVAEGLEAQAIELAVGSAVKTQYVNSSSSSKAAGSATAQPGKPQDRSSASAAAAGAQPAINDLFAKAQLQVCTCISANQRCWLGNLYMFA